MITFLMRTGGAQVLKRLFIFSALMCITALGFAGQLWHCSATNASGAVWNWYGQTREAARIAPENLCRLHNQKKPCEIVCFPPRQYWRCFSVDTLPLNANKDPKAPVLKQGMWYWSSFSKQIAINGARDACRHNSPFGGCIVDPNSCASS